MGETRKLAAIVAADVAGYSRLAGADEDRTLALEDCPERGPGAVHRIAREKQAAFIAGLRTETTLAAGREARHQLPRQA